MGNRVPDFYLLEDLFKNMWQSLCEFWLECLPFFSDSNGNNKYFRFSPSGSSKRNPKETLLKQLE